MHSSEESREYVAALSGHCRAILTAFANAENQDAPAADPLFVQLVGEPSRFSPEDIMQFLAAVGLVARRRVSALLPEPAGSAFTLAHFRQTVIDEAKAAQSKVLVIRKAFDLMAEMIPPVQDDTRLKTVKIMVEAHGFHGVAALCYITCRAAIEAQSGNPAVTIQSLVAEWALSEEIDLMHPDQAD